VTSCGYDAAGNGTRQTDAEGHMTRMEYDDHGRLTKRILLLGQESGSVSGQIRELRSSCRLPKSAEGGSR
jgi:YD repeat-containing protein